MNNEKAAATDPLLRALQEDGIIAAPTAPSVVQGMPDGWKLVDKGHCYSLINERNEAVAILSGPDSEENAIILARAFAGDQGMQGEVSDERTIELAGNFMLDRVGATNVLLFRDDLLAEVRKPNS